MRRSHYHVLDRRPPVPYLPPAIVIPRPKLFRSGMEQWLVLLQVPLVPYLPPAIVIPRPKLFRSGMEQWLVLLQRTKLVRNYTNFTSILYMFPYVRSLAGLPHH